MIRRLIFFGIIGALLAVAMVPAALGHGIAFTARLSAGSAPFSTFTESTVPNPISVSPPSSPQFAVPEAPTASPAICPIASPVNCATGALDIQFTDFTIPGNGVALNFTRTYSSALARANGALGFGWTDSYDLVLSRHSGAVTITQGNGSDLTFVPNGSGSYKAPSQSFATLVRDPDGGYAFTLVRAKERFAFSPSGRLLSERDLNNINTMMNYSRGQLMTVQDQAHRELTFTYSGQHIASVTDPMHRTVSFTYDAAGELATTTDAAGRKWLFSYGPGHVLRQVTDPRGGITTTSYDAAGRVTAQVDPAQAKTTWKYSGNPGSAQGSVTTMTDPDGNVTTLTYASGKLTAETQGAGSPQEATTRYTYNAGTAQVKSVTDPDGNVTRYTYDPSGNLVRATQPLGARYTSSYGYNSLDEVTSVRTPLGYTTSYVYGSAGNLVKVTDPMGHVTTYSYQGAPGEITRVSAPAGQVTNYAYDQAGDISSVSTRPMPHTADTTAYSYDRDGELVCEVSANALASGAACPAGPGKRVAGTTQVDRDGVGEITRAVDADGHVSTYAYDRDGNLSQSTDAQGHVTAYTYDPDGRQLAVTDPSGSVALSSYDPDGNPVGETDPDGNITSYTYDPLGRVLTVTDPLGHVTRYGYDRDGNRTSMVAPDSACTRYGYDADGDLLSTTYSDGSTPAVHYTYNADGERASMQDGTGTTAYTYSKAGQLVLVAHGSVAAVQYSYYPSGQLKSLTYPDGQVVTHRYDGAGQLISVADWLGHRTRFGYDADGNLVSVRYPNGVSETSTFDKTDQLTSITDRTAHGTLASFTYVRSSVGQITTATSMGLPIGPQVYSYTPEGRLSSDNRARYTYDRAGNLTQLPGGVALSYNAAGELTSETQPPGSAGYGYDQQGNRISVDRPGKPAITLTYDQADRLTAYGSAATYTYNGDGLRVSKAVRGVTTTFAWDQSGTVPLLISAGPDKYVDGPGGQPFEQVQGRTVTYLHSDQQGSIRLLTSAAGAVVGTYSYDPYGVVRSHAGKAQTALQFNGEYVDAESGYQYEQARYYDPATGQFLSVDPEVSLTTEAYAYAGGNPLSAFDPTGLSWWNPFSWNEHTWHVIGEVAKWVGIAAGAVALCAATECLGDEAIAGAAVADSAAPAVGEVSATAGTGTEAAAATDAEMVTGIGLGTVASAFRSQISSWAQRAWPALRSQIYRAEENTEGFKSATEHVEHLADDAERVKECQHDIRSSACLLGT